MGWGGEVDWTPEAKVKIAQATQEISRGLDVDEATADRLWEGMSDVYEFMAIRGLCAYPGGEQSVRSPPLGVLLLNGSERRAVADRVSAETSLSSTAGASG